MAKEFSLPNFLLVTGFSFLGFTGAMRILDGVTITILLKIGLASLALGAFGLLVKWLLRKWDTRHSGLHSPEE